MGPGGASCAARRGSRLSGVGRRRAGSARAAPGVNDRLSIRRPLVITWVGSISVNAAPKQLTVVLARTWWAVLLRGLIAAALGGLVLAAPGISLATLALSLGSYCIADGILSAWSAIRGRREHAAGGGLLLGGLLGIGVGILTLVVSGATPLSLAFSIAVWAVSTGAVEVMVALRLLREIRGEWLLLLAGLASLGLGVLVMARPAAGALALRMPIAIYALALGILLTTLAFRVRAAARSLR